MCWSLIWTTSMVTAVLRHLKLRATVCCIICVQMFDLTRNIKNKTEFGKVCIKFQGDHCLIHKYNLEKTYAHLLLQATFATRKIREVLGILKKIIMNNFYEDWIQIIIHLLSFKKIESWMIEFRNRFATLLNFV